MGTRNSPPGGFASDLPTRWGGDFLTGLRVVIDGSGLERPRAGVGVYTTQILHAMAVDRPDWRLIVFGPAGGFAHVPEASYHLLPRTRLIGRHLQWPAAMRRLSPDVYFGPAG